MKDDKEELRMFYTLQTVDSGTYQREYALSRIDKGLDPESVYEFLRSIFASVFSENLAEQWFDNFEEIK